MSEITFNKKTEGYVAEYTSEGRTVVQIQGVKMGRLSVYQFIDTMEPCKMCDKSFSNSVFVIDVPATMKVRLVSDVEVKAVKSLVLTQPASAAASAMNVSESGSVETSTTSGHENLD